MANISITLKRARTMAREYWAQFKEKHDHECGFENNAPCRQCLHMIEGYIHGVMDGASEEASRRLYCHPCSTPDLAPQPFNNSEVQ